MNYNDLTYNELINKKNEFLLKKKSLIEECAKNNKTYDEYMLIATPIMENIFLIDKEIRIKQTPVMEYGKSWKGDVFTIEEFLTNSINNFFTDNDGIGYYATDSAKSNILVYPSDFEYGIYRKDFTHIIWFNK